MSKHVIIIGGGLAGLSSAWNILKLRPKTQITLLESQDRVGGRTLSKKISGAWFDLGGMWVGPHQKHIINLARSLGNDLFVQPDTGNKILELYGKPQKYKSDIPNNVNLVSLVHLQLVINKLNRLAKQVPCDKPFEAEKAKLWDSMTVQSWIDDQLVDVKLKKLVEVVIRAVFGVEPSEVSLLFVLWYTHQSGSFENLVEIKNANQEKKMRLGAGNISNSMLEKLKENKNFAIHLSQFVNVIEHTENKVTVTTMNKLQIEGDYLVLAMPPCAHKKIRFQPLLPQQKRFISQHNFMGSIMKVLILYKENFWTKKGFTGEVVSDSVDSPVFNIFDDSRPKEDTGEMQPALVVFINGAVQRTWESRPDMIDIILKKIKEYFDCEQALSPMHIEVQNWNQEHTIEGGPIGNFPPGVLSQLTEELATPVGRIFFAGTEFATEGQGFMDGAVQSGVRAANRIVDHMKLKKSIDAEYNDMVKVIASNKDDCLFERISSLFAKNKGYDIVSNYKTLGNMTRDVSEYDRYSNKKCEFNAKFFIFVMLISIICYAITQKCI